MERQGGGKRSEGEIEGGGKKGEIEEAKSREGEEEAAVFLELFSSFPGDKGCWAVFLLQLHRWSSYIYIMCIQTSLTPRILKSPK